MLYNINRFFELERVSFNALKELNFQKNAVFFVKIKTGQDRLSDRIDLANFDLRIWKIRTR